MALGGVCACRLADEQKGKSAIAEKKGPGKMYQATKCMGKKGPPFHCLDLLAFVPFFHGSPGEWAPPADVNKGPWHARGPKKGAST